MSYVTASELTTRRNIDSSYEWVLSLLINDGEGIINEYCWVDSFNSTAHTEYIHSSDVILKDLWYHFFPNNPNPSWVSIDDTSVTTNIIYDKWFFRVKSLNDYWNGTDSYIKVNYTWWYSTIPSVVKQAIIRYVQEQFALSNPWVIQSNIQTYQLADERVTYRSSWADTESWKDILKPYKRANVFG